jgi:hypothetical protein
MATTAIRYLLEPAAGFVKCRALLIAEDAGEGTGHFSGQA